MLNTTTYQTAYRKFQRALIEAARIDPDLSTAGNQKRQREAIAKARADLLAAAPTPPEGPDPLDVMLDELGAKTSEGLALQDREWAKVEKLLAGGKRLENIIANAEPRRLAAILDNLETYGPVMESFDPDGIIGEVRAHARNRLTERGQDIQEALEAKEERDQLQSWHDVLTKLADGHIHGPQRNALHAADRDGYDYAFGPTNVISPADSQLLQRAVRVLVDDLPGQEAGHMEAGQ